MNFLFFSSFPHFFNRTGHFLCAGCELMALPCFILSLSRSCGGFCRCNRKVHRDLWSISWVPARLWCGLGCWGWRNPEGWRRHVPWANPCLAGYAIRGCISSCRDGSRHPCLAPGRDRFHASHSWVIQETPWSWCPSRPPCDTSSYPLDSEFP